jgi:hypothetical protein
LLTHEAQQNIEPLIDKTLKPIIAQTPENEVAHLFEQLKTVTKFTPNQILRRFELCITGAKTSSSSSKPAIDMTECSASSRMTSTTSSIVIRPITSLF